MASLEQLLRIAHPQIPLQFIQDVAWLLTEKEPSFPEVLLSQTFNITPTQIIEGLYFNTDLYTLMANPINNEVRIFVSLPGFYKLVLITNIPTTTRAAGDFIALWNCAKALQAAQSRSNP